MSTLPPKPRLLVAEDDPLARAVVVEALTDKGYDVVAVEDGAAALEAATRAAFDLCILDVEMPRLDGVSACLRLRQAPLTAAMPILFLTSHADEETIKRAFAAGASDFLPKPVHVRLLWNRVANLLAAKRLSDEAQDLREKVAFLRGKKA
jgi:CheY-like chemotaxis protein